MEKTAVEWLFDRLQSEPFLTYEDFVKAKEIEKEQNIKAYISGSTPYRGISLRESAEHYFNKTYEHGSN